MHRNESNRTHGLATSSVSASTADATVVLLVRHAATDAVGHRLSGRTRGVHLNGQGVVQADDLGYALGRDWTLAALYSSPLERALETARAIVRYQDAPLHVCEGLNEIDFGAWTGQSFAALDADPAWQLFNTARSKSCIPGGEQPLDVQRRMVVLVEQLAIRHRGGTIALISHADVVRFALLHYAGLSLDRYETFDIQPASVSALWVAPHRGRILFVNEQAL